ncbi:MAG: hypothetical protein H6525_02120 [Actinobacteria bacterium]|nr:hypothetical protein [Actinomycetota bacterium]
MTSPANFQHGQRAAEDVLRVAAESSFWGRIDLTSTGGEVARVWCRDATLLAVSVPGPRPRIGVRLLSAGLVGPAELDAALREQSDSVNPEPLGSILLRRGAIDRVELESVVRGQLIDQLADLLGWPLIAAAQFSGDAPAAPLESGTPVAEALRKARARLWVWDSLLRRLGGPQGVASPSMLAAPRADIFLGPYDWAVLTKVDGVRSLEVLAAECGLSIYECAQIVDALMKVGLVVLPPTAEQSGAGTAELLRELAALNKESKSDS